MIVQHTMFQIGCDAEDCDVRTMRLWNDRDAALNYAESLGWKIKASSHFCEMHLQDVCSDDDCEETDGLVPAKDGWVYCATHVVQGGGQECNCSEGPCAECEL